MKIINIIYHFLLGSGVLNTENIYKILGVA